MIAYKNSKQKFLQDVDTGGIGEIVRDAVQLKLRKRVGESEFRSWVNSLEYMGSVLTPDDVPSDAGIAIEYCIPRTSNRIDFLVSGKGEEGRDNIVLIELKQWSEAELTPEDAIVRTRFGGGMHPTVHPSYQAWSYAALLNGFNEAVYSNDIHLEPCAFLHNYTRDDIIDNEFYEDHIKKAPLFCKADRTDLREFIARHVRHGDKKDLIFKLENARIRPSKVLAEQVTGMLQGSDEFVMIDAQKVIYEKALAFARNADEEKKKVLIVDGGPGTGKSVIAINLLANLTKLGLFGQYVTKNSAPRTVYESKLTGTFRKTEISNFFSGSGAFTESKLNSYDVLIVDEAHRLNEKSGLFSKGENQIKEIIHSSKASIFFVDEAQRIHIKDIGGMDEIRHWAKHFDADVDELELTAQFRCSGSDAYLAWMDNWLGIRETANLNLSETNYDFRVFDSPIELRDAIVEKNGINNKSRLVAGYCWDWVSKKDPRAMDIEVPEFDFAMQWNLGTDGMLWMVKPDSVNQIGCIHTCQGLELDYIGVIIGPDMRLENGDVITDPSARSKYDRSIFGWKSQMKKDPATTTKKLDSIIRNTYRTLMTRGMNGCFIYAIDKELNEYLKSALVMVDTCSD
jgi:uncharacterized protein